MMKTFFTIYSQRLAGYLLLNGFTLIKLTEDKKTGRNNFVFVNSPLIGEYIDRWSTYKEIILNNCTGDRKNEH